MGPIYDLLGLRVGVLQMSTSADGNQVAYIYDPNEHSLREETNLLRPVRRAEAYLADITYGTNSEFGFDYLRDNITMSWESRVQRGHHYAIVDEVDNILIDEARTPLIISGPSHEDAEYYIRMAQIAKGLNPEDYEVDEKDRTVSLTEIGVAHVEEMLGMPLSDPERPEDITPEQAHLLGFLEQSLRAQFLFHRNKDYIVQNGQVIIVDEFTGRMMPGRRWSDGLHQAIEAKEGVKVQAENVTQATITIQNYFRMYKKLAGMTGTAMTEQEEFYRIYGWTSRTSLPELRIPRHAPPNSDLVELEAKGSRMAINTAITLILPTHRRSRSTSSAKISRMWFTRTNRGQVAARLCKKSSTITSSAGPQLIGSASWKAPSVFRSASPLSRCADCCKTLLIRESLEDRE